MLWKRSILIVLASVQQGRTRLTRLRKELFSDSFQSCFSLDLWAGQISMLYSNGVGCCLMSIMLLQDWCVLLTNFCLYKLCIHIYLLCRKLLKPDRTSIFGQVWIYSGAFYDSILIHTLYCNIKSCMKNRTHFSLFSRIKQLDVNDILIKRSKIAF